MKYILATFVIAFHFFAVAQTPCENGYAGEFPCNNVELLSIGEEKKEPAKEQEREAKED